MTFVVDVALSRALWKVAAGDFEVVVLGLLFLALPPHWHDPNALHVQIPDAISMPLCVLIFFDVGNATLSVSLNQDVKYICIRFE